MNAQGRTLSAQGRTLSASFRSIEGLCGIRLLIRKSYSMLRKLGARILKDPSQTSPKECTNEPQGALRVRPCALKVRPWALKEIYKEL